VPEAREHAPLTEAAPLPPPEIVLVRYGELALKGGNRRQFEDRLSANIRDAARGIARVEVERRRGRLAVMPEKRTEDVARRLQEVFGIKSVSPAWGSPSDPEAIARIARPVLVEALAAEPPDREIAFRVHTSRGDKDFPLNSIELDRFVAERIMPGLARLRVRLDDPELTLGIDVRLERSYVFVRRLPPRERALALKRTDFGMFKEATAKFLHHGPNVGWICNASGPGPPSPAARPRRWNGISGSAPSNGK